MPTLRDVKEFWEGHPVCAYEIDHEPGTRDFFAAHDRLKLESTDRFHIHLWEFSRHPGECVLDVGCGPGWLVQEYARGKAHIFGVDITRRAIQLAKKRLAIHDLRGEFLQGNAEDLPFPDNRFDFISCIGVLHHTPDTQGAIREIHRVLKPRGKTVISLYYRHFIFTPFLWPWARILLRHVLARAAGRQEIVRVQRTDDFVRLYDGDHNPLGKSYSISEVRKMFSCFSKVRFEIHYFPQRFFDSLIKLKNRKLLFFLDRYFGSMIYGIAEK